jgi:NADH-quinone oxidoreductase subunit F
MNNETCMVRIAKFFMRFTQHESCGKCIPCREGTKQMLAILEDITEGRGTEETLELLKTLAENVKIGSLCGLGKTAPNPVLSTLKHFRSEYEAHVLRKVCPARECKSLLTPDIDPALCKGCTICVKKCPTGAIHGERKMPHTIDAAACIRCGACVEACKFNAIAGV